MQRATRAGTFRASGRTVGCVVWLAVLATLAPVPVRAHPHVFVDYRVMLLFESAGLTGVRFAWTFDEMVSSALHQRFDTNRDGRFSAAESQAIEAQFRALRREGFYLAIRLDGRPVAVEDVSGFEAYSVDGRVTYMFTVKLAGRREGRLDMRVDDPTYFTAFEPVRAALAEARGAPGYQIDCRVLGEAGAFDPLTVTCTHRPTGK
jgi:ABC-type uncharacterized transport system substrate-binding protein